MTNLLHSAYIKRGSVATNVREYAHHQPETTKKGVGHLLGRKHGIDDFLNNYTLTVDAMAEADPLPKLIPIRPFPDPYLDEEYRKSVEDSAQRDKWACDLRYRISWDKIAPVDRFPRKGDWMHDWSEYMYRVGACGARTKK